MRGCILIKKDNTRITVTIPKTLHKLLKKDASYEDRSVGNFAARILKQHYDFKEESEEVE